MFENRLFGKNPIWEALKVGRAMEKLYVAEGVEDASIEGILGIARREKVALQRVPRAVLDEMVPGAKHQGLVAELPAKDYVPLDTLVENAFSQTKSPLFILLDEVQDPHNLGAIIRTADCSGADGVVVLEHRAVGLTATVAKVSAGALEHMPVSKVTNLVRCIELLQQKGVTVIGADTEGKSCYSVDMRGPIALVIGNEGLGLRRLVHEQCDALAGIPLKGHVDSLNASVAAAVLMFEAVRQRQEI
ncbi:MAG: 23S rRNA (guanosine(2251)-2'-O)-methyltransferase RlmB [Christensenellales bacterium]